MVVPSRETSGAVSLSAQRNGSEDWDPQHQQGGKLKPHVSTAFFFFLKKDTRGKFLSPHTEML
jgi:hypothetical protein